MERVEEFIKRYKWCLLALQAIICCGMFLVIFFTQKGIQKVSLTNADMAGGYIMENGGIHIDETDGAYGLYLNVYTDEIQRGWYKVHVWYETGYDDNGFLVRAVGGNPNAINTDIGEEIETIILKSQNREKSVHVWAKEPTRLQISAHFCGGGYLDINRIELERVANYTAVFWVMALFLAADVLFWEKIHISQVERKKRSFARAGVIFITFIASIPLMNRYILMGNDIMFHLCRIEGIAEGLCARQFPVRIMPQWWDEYGYGASMFYGDTLLYIPAIMLLLNYRLQTAYKFYMALLNFMTAWFAYKGFEKISKDQKIALFGSAIYSLNLFRLMNIYFSNGVGVYTAMAFLPLIMAGLYCIKEKGGWVYLALGLTGCIQSHMMTCEMIGIFIILFIIVCIKWVCQKAVILNLCKAGFVVLLWNLWFIVPFLNLYPGDYKLKQMDKLTSNIQENGKDFIDWLHAILESLNGQTSNSHLGQFIGVGSVAGVLLVLVTLIIKRDNSNKEMKHIRVGAGIFGGATVIALFLCTKYFPYDFLCEKSEILAALIRSLQFQWRFLEVASVFAVTAIVLGFVIWKILGYRKICIWTAGILGGICLLETTFYYHRLLIESPQKTKIDEYYAMPEAMGGAEEYLPSAVERLYEQHQLIRSEDTIEIKDYEKKYTNIVMSCRNMGEEGYVDVPLFFYPCYKAKDMATGEVLPLTYGENAKIRITLPAGYQGTIKLKVNERKLWKIADIISVVSVVLFIIRLIWENTEMLFTQKIKK